MFFQIYFACCSAFFSSVALLVLLVLLVSFSHKRKFKRALKNVSSKVGKSK